jgi:hypothetical protein
MICRVGTNRKGAELERRAIAILQAQGYLVHRTVRTPFVIGGGFHRSHNNDIFGCFDLLAIRQTSALHHPARGMRCIQVTDITHVAKRQKKVASTVGDWFPTCMDYPRRVRLDLFVTREVWGWVGGRRGAKTKRGKAVKRAQCFRVTRWDAALCAWVDEQDASAPPLPRKQARRRRACTTAAAAAAAGSAAIAL